MCEQCSEESLTRRRFLVLSGTGVAAGILLPGVSAAQSRSEFSATPIGNGHVVLPRDVWGADLPPTGPMESEAPDDVRFLIVHHSASTNDYSAERSTGMLQSFYRFHTSREKGWPDIAYNFLIDRYGQIFEGRAGSISSPVRGDATGGSQGFALLCCFIGDHSAVAPTAAAQSAMISLLHHARSGAPGEKSRHSKSASLGLLRAAMADVDDRQAGIDAPIVPSATWLPGRS